jgi:hypothetical protein
MLMREPIEAISWKAEERLMERTLVEKGYIATLRKARKAHKCHVCDSAINPGSCYYSVVKGGGGLGWLKFPDRVHLDCLEDYLRRPAMESQGGK